MVGLVGARGILVGAPSAAFLLRELTEQNAQFLIDLIALFDKPSCMR